MFLTLNVENADTLKVIKELDEHSLLGSNKEKYFALINGLIIVFTRGAILFSVVFPAKAGNQLKHSWMPAFAGMTDVGLIMRPLI